jgi:hypothetical protein
LGHVKPGYLTVLGDDDGFVPGAFQVARYLLAKYNVRALAWQKAEYHWPDHIVPEYRNWLQVPLANLILRLNAIRTVKDVIAFRAGSSRLPCVYNSFVSTELIEAYRAKTGGPFFGGSIPDVYSGFALASEVDEFLFCERPLSVNGASSKSNGTVQAVGDKTNRLAASFWQDTKHRFESGLPDSLGVVEFCIADSFLKVKRVAPKFSVMAIDSAMLLRSGIQATFSGFIPEQRQADRLAALRDYAQVHALIHLFELLCREVQSHPRGPALAAPGYYPGQSLVFDSSDLEALDVFSVADRVGDVLDIVENKPDLFTDLVRDARPDFCSSSLNTSLLLRGAVRPAIGTADTIGDRMVRSRGPVCVKTLNLEYGL